MIPYGKHSISKSDIDAVVDVLKSDFLTQGPLIREFEKAFAKYCGAKYAVAVTNGTAALHLSALTQINPGDKVITTPNSFVATTNCITYCQGEAHFVDIDPSTYLIDVNKIEQLLLKNPPGTFKGIIPVDFAGYPLPMEDIHRLAVKHNLWIIQDSCHAPGAWFSDSMNEKILCGSGKYADLTVFSFHPVKHIATGEGGMITTNNENLYKKLLNLRTHGITKNEDELLNNHGGWYYEMHNLGYNYRITDFQCALGLNQLKRLDENIEKRNIIANVYNKAFEDLDIITSKTNDKIKHAYHLYVIQTKKRKELYDHLKKQNIFAQVHYIPIHLQPYYRKRGWKLGDFPIAESYYDNCLSLPMYPTLTPEEQKFVIEQISRFINQ